MEQQPSPAVHGTMVEALPVEYFSQQANMTGTPEHLQICARACLFTM